MKKGAPYLSPRMVGHFSGAEQMGETVRIDREDAEDVARED